MTKKISILILLYISAIFCLPTTVCAQKISVDARIDSPFIYIGQQTDLHLEVTQKNENLHVLFPFFSEEIIPGIEIIETLKIDSLRSADNLLIVKHQYKISSFNDSLFYLPPFPFVVDKDTFWSKAVSLKVIQPFDIDTTNNAITDIKPIYTPPFYWGNILKKTFFALFILLVLLGTYWLLQRMIRKFKSSKNSPLPKAKAETPAHIIAIEKLKQIENDKAWIRGDVKKTYTELTDTIRIYFSKRFQINSLEMTSEEILASLYFMRKSQKETYNKLSTFFERADLVKFAKFKPLNSETEQSIKDAFLFVNQTKEENEKKEEIKENRVESLKE